MVVAEHSGAEPQEDDDYRPTLSLHTLAVLNEFLSQQPEGRHVQQHSSVEEDGPEPVLLSEDWKLSQFWYERETAEAVAGELLRLSALTHSPIACIACPTLYAYLKKMEPSAIAQLLEYDTRFQQYGSDFIYYDYNQPEELPLATKHAFQVIVADPPYLSRECLEKVAQTINFLSKPGGSYLLLLTGAVQQERAEELLQVSPCGFRPKHSSKLGNEFMLFTNYDPADKLGGWQKNS